MELPQLESERLLLRPLEIADAEVLFQLVNNRAIAANTRSIPWPYPREMAVNWIEDANRDWQAGRSAVFGICVKPESSTQWEGWTSASAMLIGSVGLEICAENENAELGYWIGEAYWNCGYCSEACRQVVSFGFEQLGLAKIHAHHMTRNPASGRVLQNIGMRREGLLRRHFKKWGKFEDVVCYGMLRGEQ